MRVWGDHGKESVGQTTENRGPTTQEQLGFCREPIILSRVLEQMQCEVSFRTGTMLLSLIRYGRVEQPPMHLGTDSLGGELL